MAFCHRYRFVIVFIIFLTSLSAYIGRNTLSIAILEMTQKKHFSKADGSDVCPNAPLYNNNVTDISIATLFTHNYENRFDWSQSTQSYILIAFYIGYIVNNIPSGMLVQQFGPRWVASIGLLATGLINLATPFIAHKVQLFIGARVLLGLFQAGLFSCMFALLTKWIPENERNTVIAIKLIGSIVGSIFSTWLTGKICEKYDWPIAFYICGIIATIVAVLFLVLTTNEPKDHCFVSQQELAFIKQNIPQLLATTDSTKQRPFPWYNVLTSSAFWTAQFPKFIDVLIFNINVIKMPQFLKEVIGLNIQTTGLYSGITLGVLGVSELITGATADYILKRRYFQTKTIVRKIFVAISMIGVSIFLLLFLPVGCNAHEILYIYIGAMIFLGLNTGGVQPLSSDHTNEFTPTYFALSNTINMTTGVLAPQVLGILFEHYPLHMRLIWYMVFCCLAGLSIVSALVFVFFGTAEPQNWGYETTGKKEKNKFVNETDGIYRLHSNSFIN